MKRREPRNPGPSWGYRLIRSLDRILPDRVMKALLRAGAGVAMWMMREQRRHSRRFLNEALGRRAGWRDCWLHFSAFATFLLNRFQVASGREPRFVASDECEDRLEGLARSQRQALYGTFHFGQSDLMGFWLSKFGLSIRMVREQVGNSQDLDWLDQRFGGSVGFLWVNNPAEMLFALKAAVAEGHSIAMKCDRIAHSSKREVFEFMGRARWFPFSIYHLSVLFQLPVVFAFGLLNELGEIEVHSSRCFWPDESGKGENLKRAREHFKETLALLERLVRQEPYQWFNFMEALPLAPEEDVA